MTLHAIDNDRAGLRAAPSDLDGVAHLVDVAGFTQHAVIELFSALRRPLQQLYGAVDGDVFLIAGDQERDRAFRLATVGREIVQYGGNRAGDATLHVHRAAAIEHAVLDVPGECAVGPCRFVTGGHHVGVPREGDVRRLRADACIEIVDVGRAGFGEGDAMHLEPGIAEQLLQYAERARVCRRHGGTTQQIAGDGESVGRHWFPKLVSTGLVPVISIKRAPHLRCRDCRNKSGNDIGVARSSLPFSPAAVR